MNCYQKLIINLKIYLENENIIKECEKLPNKIKLSLEKGKLINKEWDNNNLNSYIYDCINIFSKDIYIKY